MLLTWTSASKIPEPTAGAAPQRPQVSADNKSHPRRCSPRNGTPYRWRPKMNWKLPALFVSLFVAVSPALGESAEVKGGVSCSGVDVGLSMEINGDIDAA